MIDIRQVAPDFFEMTVSGTVTAEDVERAFAALRPPLMEVEPVRLIGDLTAFEGMTVDAMATDFREGMRLLQTMSAPVRAAILSDRDWIRRIAEMEAALLPQIDISTFKSTERAAAEEWVRQETRPTADTGGGLSIIETDSDNVLAFEINGTISEADLDTFRDAFGKKRATAGKVRLLNRIRHIGGVNRAALTSGALFRIKGDAAADTERYAVVGGPQFVKTMMDSFAPLLTFQVRHFNADEEDAAWNWVEAKPARD